MSTAITPAEPPPCDLCDNPMRWLELLRTWGCTTCGYFMDNVCGRCGQVEDGSSCGRCGQKMAVEQA